GGRAAGLLEQQTQLDDPAAVPSVFFRDAESEQVRARKLRPQFGVEPSPLVLEVPEPFVGAIAMEDLPREITNRLLVFREREVHRHPAARNMGSVSSSSTATNVTSSGIPIV